MLDNPAVTAVYGILAYSVTSSKFSGPVAPHTGQTSGGVSPSNTSPQTRQTHFFIGFYLRFLGVDLL